MPRRTLNPTVSIKCQDGQWKAKPNMIIVQRGETIDFQKPFGVCTHIQASGIGVPFKIKKDELTGHLRVPLNTQTGFYPYAVFCCEQEAFCTGSSMPIIIVPPKSPTTS